MLGLTQRLFLNCQKYLVFIVTSKPALYSKIRTIREDLIIFRHTRLNVTNLKLCRAKNICLNLKTNTFELSSTVLNGSYLPSFDETYFTTLSGIRENIVFGLKLKYYSTVEEEDKQYRIGVVQASNPFSIL